MSIGTLVAVAAVISGYFLARNFVRRRLRFVDAAQSIFAPLVAGVLAAILASPLALIPTLSGWTAIMFGVGAALGASSARRQLRRADWELRRLAP
jgi:MFS family permease